MKATRAAQRAYNLREKAAYREYVTAHGSVRGGQKGFRRLMRRRPVGQRPLSSLSPYQRSKRETALGVLDDGNLRTIARQVVETVRKNVSIDWTVKETVRAKLRLYVKRILKKAGYPPSGQEAATQTVLQQAELMAQGGIAFAV